MGRRIGWLLALLLCAVLTASVTWPVVEAVEDDDGDEVKVDVKDLPKNVVAVVKKLVPDGEIVSAEKETVKDKEGIVAEYEVKVRKGDKVIEIEILVDAEGNVKKAKIDEEDEENDD